MRLLRHESASLQRPSLRLELAAGPAAPAALPTCQEVQPLRVRPATVTKERHIRVHHLSRGPAQSSLRPINGCQEAPGRL